MHLAAHGFLLRLLRLQFVDGFQDAVAQLKTVAEVPVQLQAIARARVVEHALGVAGVGHERGQRGKALGLAALHLGGGALNQVTDLAQLGALRLGCHQCSVLAGRHPLQGHLHAGQPVAGGRVVEVAREARQRIHALRLQRMLLSQRTGAARCCAQQIVAAHGAQFGTALLHMGELTDGVGRLGSDARLAVETLQFQQGSKCLKQHVLARA
ncbi:hypothetical protein SDC9_151819 [bioreactor metagenome]|uniref:Uncharacterized protein n=1 Tax=bioreactor metagenome TaxID=1076179 RepID=A0A645ERB7_9ZZZZ